MHGDAGWDAATPQVCRPEHTCVRWSATYPEADAHRGIGLTLTTLTHMSYMLALVVVLMLLGAVTAVVVVQLAVSREAVVGA